MNIKAYLYLTIITGVALLGMSYVQAHNISLLPRPRTPIVTSPRLNGQRLATIKTSSVQLVGTTDPDMNILLNINDRGLYQPSYTRSNIYGQFSVSFPVGHKKPHKHFRVLVYAQNPTTRTLSKPALLDLIVQRP